jgi:hypothetical protein
MGNRGEIDEFALGEHDTPDRLLIPEKLYGRAAEINALLASFDRIVAGGRPEQLRNAGEWHMTANASPFKQIFRIRKPIAGNMGPRLRRIETASP